MWRKRNLAALLIHLLDNRFLKQVLPRIAARVPFFRKNWKVPQNYKKYITRLSIMENILSDKFSL